MNNEQSFAPFFICIRGGEGGGVRGVSVAL